MIEGERIGASHGCVKFDGKTREFGGRDGFEIFPAVIHESCRPPSSV